MNPIFKRLNKYFFKLFLMSSVNERYVREPAAFEAIVSADPRKTFIFVIGFNQRELIMLQHAAVKKFLANNYEYFIIDNSSKPAASEEIKEYCLTNKVNYIRLPKNPGIDGSIHEGLALNWMYRNVVLRFKPAVFGIMDHDLFPVARVDITSMIERGDAWGIITDRTTIWTLWRPRFYLWSGLAFYRLDKFREHEPNFLPVPGFDTAGRIRVDTEMRHRLPEVYDLFRSPVMDIAPGVTIYRYGNFVHFQGSTWEPKDSLDVKKRWMRKIIETGTVNWPLHFFVRK
jgi:hypothetical protein